MAAEKQKQGGDLFIVDNSDEHWKALEYLKEWAGYPDVTNHLRRLPTFGRGRHMLYGGSGLIA